MADAPSVPGPLARSGAPDRARWPGTAQVARYLGAAALLGVGADHLWQFSVDFYSAIPTIGTLFALNFASALVVALALAAPLERLSDRWGRAALTLLAVTGWGIALGSLVGLEVSESTTLFGFMEPGYRGGVVLSIVLDAATIILLGAFLGAGLRGRPSGLAPALRRTGRAPSARAPGP
jgi:hypothetical protein